MNERLLVRETILDCTRCPKHTDVNAPVPFRGPTPAPIAVVAGHLSDADDTAGAPLTGDVGAMLDQLLTGAGFDPAALFYCGSIACAGIPDEEHVVACRPNRLAQLDLAAPTWVLLLGSAAIFGFRDDLPRGKGRGVVFQPAGVDYRCFGTYHPAMALQNPRVATELLRDLTQFKEHTETMNWHDTLEMACVDCGDEIVTWIDDGGICWCANHLPPDAVRWFAA